MGPPPTRTQTAALAPAAAAAAVELAAGPAAGLPQVGESSCNTEIHTHTHCWCCGLPIRGVKITEIDTNITQFDKNTT